MAGKDTTFEQEFVKALSPSETTERAALIGALKETGNLDASGVPSAAKLVDGAAAQVANLPGTSPRISAWHRKVTEEVDDTSVLVLSDSTGNGLTRWVRRTCDKIAAQFPRQTVIYRPWDDSTKTYPIGSAVTVQTGVSGRTITVYNCAVSGQVIGYALSNITTITSGLSGVSVMIFNYGYNSPQDKDNYRALVHQGINAYASRFINAAIVNTSQGPNAAITTGITTAAEYAPNQLRQAANYEYAVANGYPIVDVNSAFRAYGDYNADLLLDGRHPNEAGNAIWANLVWEVLRPKAGVAPASEQVSRVQRIWIPAKSFDALDGSPTYAMNFGIGGWLLDPTTEESVSVVTDYPSDWQYIDVNAWFACPTAPDVSNRTVVVRAASQWVGGDNSGNTTSTTLGTWTDSPNGNVSIAMPTTLGMDNAGSVFTRQGGSRKPLAFKIARKAADPADTLAQDAIFLGMFIQRMF